MPLLSLTVADGRLLNIPAHAVRTIQGVPAGKLTAFPDAASAIRYLIGAEVRLNLLRDSPSQVHEMVVADPKTDAQLIEVTDAEDQPFWFRAQDLVALEEVDPEAEATAGYNAAIDLDINGVGLKLRAKADAREIAAVVNPEPVKSNVHAIPRARTGRRKAT